MLMHFCITTVSPASFQDSVINLERNPNHPLYKFDEAGLPYTCIRRQIREGPQRSHAARPGREFGAPHGPRNCAGRSTWDEWLERWNVNSSYQTSQTQVSTAARGLAYLDENDVAAPSIKQDAPHSDE